MRYRWTIEFEIKKHLKEIDLIHLMYGEEYLRFTPYFYPNKPIVVTFHQPFSRLKNYFDNGNGLGKIDSLTHKITKGRFKKIDRVILTEKNQMEALKGLVPEEKVRIIPLGIYLADFFQAFQEYNGANIPRENKVIVLGNWLRDWELLLQVALELNKNEVKIHLVGRNIPLDEKHKLREAPNIIVEKDLSDRELKNLLYTSKVSFLPLKEAAGNNALMESLAMGCHAVMSNVVSDSFPFKGDALSLINGEEPALYAKKILEVFEFSESQYNSFALKGQEAVKPYDWQQVANKTIEVYKELL